MTGRSESAEVAVWWMEIDSPPSTVVSEWRLCLDAQECAKADRFYFAEDQSNYVAAHWLLRRALAVAGELPPGDWRFIDSPGMKPRIDPSLSALDLRFSLSHTKGLVACAVSIGIEIGIDVEAIDRPQAGLDIAERFFSPTETAILHATPPDRQSEIFMRLWTLKEAFIKATGEGLSRDLRSFSLALDPVAILFHSDSTYNTGRWQFIESRPTSRHVLALALECPANYPVKLRLHEMS
jgi:4'-phosphopantetheinyl transferase